MISNDIYNRKTSDIVVVALTSNPAIVAYSFTITSSDLERGSLNRPSKVRVDKIYTLSQTIVVATFGQVNSTVLDRIRNELQALTASNTSL